MSLQVWLPLTKDLRQQGLSTTTYTQNSGTTISSGGKLGSCLTATSNATVVVNLSSLATMLANGKTYSLACWVKITNNVTSSWVIKLGTNSCGLWWAASEARWVWNENDNGKRCANPTISADTNWHHLCIVVDKTVTNKITTKQYVDGVLAANYPGSTWDCSSHSQPAGTTITIYPYAAQLNDIRIYDHCLSPMEVKELAKGLVLHYPLSSQFETGQTNKYSSPYSDGYCSSSSWTRTQLIDERGWNYKLTKTGDGNNSWPNCAVPTYSFTSGKTYYYSVKVRCNKWTNGTLTLRASRSSNDWVTRGVTVCSSSLADGKWHEYYTYQTINDTYDRSGTTVTCAPVLEFYCSNMNGNGTIYDMDFDLKDIQVIESDCYVPFIENSFVSTTIYDCSGFCNNGTRTGTSTFSTDCPKYQGGTKLASGNKIVSTSGMITTANPTFTCNLWVKMPSATYTTWADIITFPGSATIRMETSNTAGTSLSWYNYPIGTSSGIGTNGTVNNTDWNMFTLTCDGTNWKTYKNGVLANTTAISGTAWTPNGTVSIGDNGMYAQLSDVRIYATALSADDVKSLYQNSAYIDSNGNVYGAVHSEV